ncbi:MAG: hypothetical protein ABII74_08805 [Elusimicrobiota bacterium]
MSKLLKKSFCFVIFLNCLANFLLAETNPNKEGLPKAIRTNKDFIEWAKKWRKIKPDFADTKFKFSDSKVLNSEDLKTIDESNARYGWDIFKRVKDEIEFNKSNGLLDSPKIESPDKSKFVFICSGGDPDISVFIVNLSSRTCQEILNSGSGTHCYNAIWVDNNRFVLIINSVNNPDPSDDHVSAVMEFYDLKKNTVTRYNYSEAISENDYEEYRSRYIFK